MRSDELKEIKAALSALSADLSLGYLAVTSKPELPVRDRVAWYFHRKHPDLIAAREYTIKSENSPKLRKRVDLAVLKRVAHDPVALVEFKAMIVPDPLSSPEHPLMVSLLDDLKRLSNTHVPHFGVMLMVHIKNVGRLRQQGLNGRVVKFMPKFLRWAKDKGHDGLKKAIENATRFFDRANLDVTPLTIKLGSVWGARVKLACFILEANHTR